MYKDTKGYQPIGLPLHSKPGSKCQHHQQISETIVLPTFQHRCSEHLPVILAKSRSESEDFYEVLVIWK